MVAKRGSNGSGLSGVLDIGTAKVCCAIMTTDGDAGPQLLGLGHQRSRGLKSGMVVDADEAERSVRSAVGQAERMAGASLDRLVLAVSCGRIRSTGFTARAEVEGPVVRDADLDRILAGGEAYLDRTSRSIIQLMRSDWHLDGASGIRDPRGLAGRALSVDLNAVTADDGPVRNLMGVIERCHITVERMVATPYASALAVATEEERRLGVLVVELGAGLTSFAAFADGRLLHVDSVPVGGNHVTFDIARELVTTVAEAERIKTLYGTLIKAASDDGDLITYPIAGEDEGTLHQTSKAFVRDVVTPRIAGLLELLAERIGEAGLDELAGRRVVLTGGASQLLGLDQAWSRRFGGSARIGRPQPIGRMPGSMCSPAFSAVIGLMCFDALSGDVARPGSGSGRRQQGYFDRMQRWIAESF